jgi:hypothetical protein
LPKIAITPHWGIHCILSDFGKEVANCILHIFFISPETQAEFNRIFLKDPLEFKTGIVKNI